MQLDSISAGGFDINVEAVIALRQTIEINQKNIAAVITANGDINKAVINNSNYASADGANRAVVSQNNIACLIALEGGVYDSTINNVNQGSISNIAGTSVIKQSNVGVIIAKGYLSGNRINNLNALNFYNAAGNLSINQVSNNISVFTFNDFSGIVAVNNN